MADRGGFVVLSSSVVLVLGGWPMRFLTGNLKRYRTELADVKLVALHLGHYVRIVVGDFGNVQHFYLEYFGGSSLALVNGTNCRST
jgi:hypothetical protein